MDATLHEAQEAGRAPRVLFVAWPEPDTRAYRVVGRLLRVEWGDGHHFEFAYTRGADTAKQFTPFMAFPELDRVYRSDTLFPFFSNRLMSPKRPDHGDLLQRLGLDVHDADPFDVLVRTSGVRATDSVELFGMPELVFGDTGETVCYDTHFLAHGFRYLKPEEQEAVAALVPGERLTCRPEPENPADRNAMLLVQVRGVKVGYLPRYLAPDAGTLHNLCDYLSVTVDQVNAPPAPTSQRLLCRLSSCVPAGFAPFAGPDYHPRTEGATVLPNPFAPQDSLPRG